MEINLIELLVYLKMDTKAASRKPETKKPKVHVGVQNVDDRKPLRYDSSFGSVVTGFVVQMLDILFVLICFFWFLKGIKQTTINSNCSAAMIGWPSATNSECGNWTFFSISAFLRGVGCSIAAMAMFYLSTHAGTAAIGYGDVSKSLKMDSLINLMRFDGGLANFMICLFLLSLLMNGCSYYGDYDNLQDDSMLYVSDSFVVGQVLFGLYAVYIALRIIYSYFNLRSSLPFISVEEVDKETGAIYSHTARSNDTLAGVPGYNIAMGIATAVSVILLHVVALYAISGLIKADPDSERLYIMYFFYLMLCVNSVKQFAYVLYCFDNKVWRLKIHPLNSLFLILESSLAYSSINYNSSSANVYLAYASMILNLLIAIVALIGQFYFMKKNEAGMLSVAKKWVYSISNEKFMFFLVTTSIYVLIFCAILVLCSKLLEFNDVLETVGYDIYWAKNLVNDDATKSALLAFKTNDTSLRWIVVLFMMIDLDTIMILLIVFSLFLFSRKFMPAKTVKKIVVSVIFYQCYISFRSDAISDTVFQMAYLGYATAAPKRDVIDDISFSSRLIQMALMYVLVMMSMVKKNVAPVDTKVAAEPSKENRGRNRLPKFRPDVMQLVSLIFAAIICFLVYDSIVNDWVLMKPKNFQNVVYTNPSPSTAAARCSVQVPNSQCHRLTGSLKNFVSAMVNYRQENFPELEKISTQYFNRVDDKFGFLAPVVITWIYFVVIIVYRPPENINMLLHLVIIVNNLLNYISINVVYVIINLYVKSFPGLFFELKCDEGFDAAVYSIMLSVAYSVFSAFSFIAPIEVPERPITG